MAFAVADLVHPNHPQSIELAPLIPLLGNHSLDDPSHRTPRHSEIVRYGADVRPLCQPRYLLFEAFGKAASLVGPRHLFSDHSTPPTYHSSDRVAKIGPDSEQVQVPPVAIVAIFVLADLSSANPAQRLPPPWYYIHHHSGFVRLEVETSDPQALQSDELVD